MRRLRVLASLLFTAFAPRALAAPPVGYAQSADYLEKDSHPARYQPLNVLDARDSTVWCAGDTSRSITFGFKGVATVDEVRLYTGNGVDRGGFKAYGRARKLALQGPDGARSFTVEDKRGLQTVPLHPPISGAWLTLEVLDTFPGAEPGAPVCLTDVVFHAEGKPLNGSWLTPRLKYDARVAPLLGTWFAGLEGAPERFLSFYFDGTYRFVREPLEGDEEPRVSTGSYSVSGSRLTLELPKRGKVSLRYRREEAPSGAGAGYTLTLEGELPDEWKQPFRSKP